MKRAIKRAIKEESGEIVNAKDVFKSQKDGQLIRKKDKASKGDDYLCFECTQYLETASKRKNVFFRHKKGHLPCIYTNGSYSEKELDDFHLMAKIKEESQINFNGKRSGEGDRHKFLKNTISRKLKDIKGISDVYEEKVLNINNQIKRPDVYCKYFEKQIVFEIQISKLSARYLLSRYEFYKKNGIYLIWILDVEIENQDQFAIDIKYLNEYENFFKLDEKNKEFRLTCLYKKAWIDSNNEICSKWWEHSLTLSQLNFNNEIFQVFYQDFEKSKNEKKLELEKRIQKEKKLEEERRLADEKKKKEKRDKWKLSWIQNFNNDYQKKPINSTIMNSIDEILFFAQEDMLINEIRFYEKEFKNLRWIINATEIGYKFEIKELLNEKLSQFDETMEVYHDEINYLNEKNKENEETKKFNLNEIVQEIDRNDNNIQQFKYQFHEKETYIKQLVDDIIKGKNTISNNDFELYIRKVFSLKVTEYNKTINNLNSEIEEIQLKIERWQNTKGRIFPDKILKLKSKSEINLNEFKKNINSILVVENRKWDAESLQPLIRFDLDQLLFNIDDYTFFDDYSITIKNWSKEIKKKRAKMSLIRNDLLNESNEIEKKYELWINEQIAELKKIIKNLELKYEATNSNFIKNQNKIVEKIKGLELELEEKRNSIVDKYINKFSFYWRDFDLGWEHAKCPIFFDTGEEILFMFNHTEIGKFQYDQFISRFNK